MIVVNINDSSLNITDDEKNELKEAYEHSQSEHVQVSDIPKKTSELENDSEFVDKNQLNDAISQAQLGNKDVDLSAYQKISDKSLTTTDKTVPGAINELKNRIDNIPTNNTGEGLTSTQEAQLKEAYEHTQTKHVLLADIPKKVSQLENDSQFVTPDVLRVELSKIGTTPSTPSTSGSIQCIEYVNVDNFGAVGDGATDDTKAFQAALDSGKNITATPTKTYLLTNPLQIRKNGQNVDLQNAQILMKHSSVASANNDLVSLFNADTGTISTTYVQTELHLSQGYLTLDKVDNLAVGDMLRLYNYQGGTFEHNGSSLKPMLEIVVKIVKIDGKNVYVDYTTPLGGWNYDTTNPSSVFAVRNCNKVTNVLRDVTIRNIRVKDITPYTENHTISMSGILGRYVDNMTVENVYMDNMLLNGVTFAYAYNCKANNIEVVNARRVTGGKGYCLRNLACNKLQASNLVGKKIRHVFDVSAGAYIEIRNAYGYDTYAGAFSLHGKYEHDIYLYNLNGTDDKSEPPIIGFGSGKYFGNAVDNVFIADSNVKLYTEGYSSFGRVYFNNSSVRLYVTLPTVTFNNCYITQRTPNYSFITKRGQNIKLFSKFNNCTINAPKAITGYDYVQVSNCDITNLNISATNFIATGNVVDNLIVNGAAVSSNSESNTLMVQGNIFV